MDRFKFLSNDSLSYQQLRTGLKISGLAAALLVVAFYAANGYLNEGPLLTIINFLVNALELVAITVFGLCLFKGLHYRHQQNKALIAEQRAGDRDATVHEAGPIGEPVAGRYTHEANDASPFEDLQ